MNLLTDTTTVFMEKVRRAGCSRIHFMTFEVNLGLRACDYPKKGLGGFLFIVEVRLVDVQVEKDPLLPDKWRKCPHACMMPRYDVFMIFYKSTGNSPYTLHHRNVAFFPTSNGVFSSMRGQHGETNSVQCFIASMEALFPHLDVLIWLEDILAFVTIFEIILANLNNVLNVYEKNE